MGWYSKLVEGISNIIPKGNAANFDPEHLVEGKLKSIILFSLSKTRLDLCEPSPTFWMTSLIPFNFLNIMMQ